MTARRTRRPRVGVLLLVVVAGVVGVFLVAGLREAPARPPRAARAHANEVAASRTPVAGKPVRARPARPPESAKAEEKPVEKAAPADGKQRVEAVVVPPPALTPRQRKELARRQAANAALVSKSRTRQERQQLERHLRRFVGRGGAGHWVDPHLGALRAGTAVKAEPLPVPEPDEAERRRIEQLEKLRQRKAVGLLDHIHGGLAWLALHQAPDGSFSDVAAKVRCKGLGHEPACAGGGGANFAVPCTAFAIMALIDFRDQDVVGLFEPGLAAAVQWLRKRQRGDGGFPGQRQLYTNAIALMALAQAAESTGDEKLRGAVRRGLELFAQRPGPVGGYRYSFGASGDLSVTGWVAQAVEMARRAGVEIPPLLEPGLSEFLDSVWMGEHRFSYLTRSVDRPSLYPVGILMGRILWPDPDPSLVASWRHWVKRGVGSHRPRLYTLYYGVRVAIALEETLPDPWRRWVFELSKTQIRKGPAAGTFGRPGGWLGRAGKTLHTAVAVLTLEHALYLR